MFNIIKRIINSILGLVMWIGWAPFFLYSTDQLTPFLNYLSVYYNPVKAISMTLNNLHGMWLTQRGGFGGFVFCVGITIAMHIVVVIGLSLIRKNVFYDFIDDDDDPEIRRMDKQYAEEDKNTYKKMFDKKVVPDTDDFSMM